MPRAGKYDLTLHVMCDSYVGSDEKIPIKMKVSPQTKQAMDDRAQRSLAKQQQQQWVDSDAEDEGEGEDEGEKKEKKSKRKEEDEDEDEDEEEGDGEDWDSDETGDMESENGDLK